MSNIQQLERYQKHASHLANSQINVGLPPTNYHNSQKRRLKSEKRGNSQISKPKYKLLNTSNQSINIKFSIFIDETIMSGASSKNNTYTSLPKHQTQLFQQQQQQQRQRSARPQYENQIPQIQSMNQRQSLQQQQDYMKIFGNEKNYLLIKSLLGSTNPSVQTSQQITQPQIIQMRKIIQNENSTKNLISDHETKVEKALLDLNEIKTQIFQDKQQQENILRKTNYSQFNQTSYSTQTGEGFKKGFIIESRADSRLTNNQNQNKQRVTSNSFFSTGFQAKVGGQSLTDNIENMDRDQLKERLLVAETLMKKLYHRNKELEDFHSQKLDQTQQTIIANNDENLNTQPNEQVSAIDQIKQHAEQLSKEIEDKQKEIDDLKLQNQQLIKQSILSSNNNENDNSQYTQFLEQRVNESLQENRRLFSKYSEIRNFAYQQIELMIRQNNKKKNNNIQNNNLQVYKQLIEKERKQLTEEKQSKQIYIENLQDMTRQQEQEMNELKNKVKEQQSELETREECDTKIQEYVKTLVQKNDELQKKLQLK